MAPVRTDFDPHVAVDKFMSHELALRPNDGPSYDPLTYGCEKDAAVYRAKRIKVDKKAIANLDALPRPKLPPGKKIA